MQAFNDGDVIITSGGVRYGMYLTHPEIGPALITLNEGKGILKIECLNDNDTAQFRPANTIERIEVLRKMSRGLSYRDPEGRRYPPEHPDFCRLADRLLVPELRKHFF